MTEKTKKQEEKEEFKAIKKTAEAHGTLDEKESESKAKNTKEVTEDMLELEKEKEKALREEKEKEAIEKAEAEKAKEKERPAFGKITREELLETWEPKTKLGIDVKNEKIKNIDERLDNNKKILEEEIVEKLLNLKTDLISIGQAKGKFGGGKRRAWRQTQKKTKEGNVPTFSTLAVTGDENGHVGIGTGRAQETLPARDKAIRKAKLNIIKVRRECSSFDCACSELHTVPFKVTGRAGSVRVTLVPAPQGTGLVVANELKKMLKLAGIKDVYSKSFERKRTTFNLIKACFNALKKTNER